MEEFQPYIILNEGICRHFTECNDMASLWHYALLVWMTKDLGFSDKEELIAKLAKFTNRSVSSVRKWLPALNGLITKHGKNLHIVSKKKARFILNVEYTRASIIVSEQDLKNYKTFKKHLLTQFGLMLQRRFEYSWKEMVKTPRNSHVKSALVDQSSYIPLKKEHVGVSVSKLSEFTGISKSTIQNYIGKVKEGQICPIDYVTYKEFKKKYSSEYFKSNPTIRFHMFDWLDDSVYKALSKPYENKEALLCSLSYQEYISSICISIFNIRIPGKIIVYRKLSGRINQPNLTKRSCYYTA